MAAEPMMRDTPPPPDRQLELASDLSIAFLVLLERLGPEERAAFLLHEVFDFDYREIATVLEKSEDACRQIVHRARTRIRSERKRFEVSEAAKDNLFAGLPRQSTPEIKIRSLPCLRPMQPGPPMAAAAQPRRLAQLLVRNRSRDS